MAELPVKAHYLPREIQAFLGISTSQVYRMIEAGIIPSKRITADLLRIPRKEFLDWYNGLGGGQKESPTSP